jgi:hypothetical protein
MPVCREEYPRPRAVASGRSVACHLYVDGSTLPVAADRERRADPPAALEHTATEERR